MTSVYFFTLSFLVLSVLFLSKHREVVTGEKNLFGKSLSRLDSVSQNLIYKSHYRIYQLIQTVRYLFLVQIPEKSKVRITKTKSSVLGEYNKQKDVIMGKKELNSNGSSSFYLRKIDDDKKENKLENGERGRIEESL